MSWLILLKFVGRQILRNASKEATGHQNSLSLTQARYDRDKRIISLLHCFRQSNKPGGQAS